MAKPRDVLKKQKITFDNHKPNVPAKWDENLHFHKKMTVKLNGKKSAVSGVVYVVKEQIDVVWDRGNNNHAKIDKNEDVYREALKEEIKDALCNEDARPFLENIKKHLDSLNSGVSNEDKLNRYLEAYNNIMKSLGVSTDKIIALRNRHSELFCMYCEAGNPYFVDELAHRVMNFNKYYHHYNEGYGWDEIERPAYFITCDSNTISLGELSPSVCLEYRMKGFKLSRKGVLEGDVIINN